MDGYLIPCFDALHTLGSEYLVDDVCSLDVSNLVDDLLENEPELFG